MQKRAGHVDIETFRFVWFLLLRFKPLRWLLNHLAIADCCKNITLQWRHNERNGVSNHQPHDCLLNRLFGCRSKKTSKFRVTGLCDRWPVNSPHKRPVTRKIFPFDDAIMKCWLISITMVKSMWTSTACLGNNGRIRFFPSVFPGGSFVGARIACWAIMLTDSWRNGLTI